MLLTSLAGVASADVRGRVVDATTRRPVAGAAVYSDTGTDPNVADATSGEDGTFIVSGSPTTLTIIEDAHDPSVVEVTSASELRVVLVPRERAETIEIVDERPPKDSPGAIAIDRAKLEAIPGARGDVLSGIKNLPGIANNGSLTPLSSGLIVRGTSPEDSRILVDGFEIPILYHFLGVQSVIPTEMLAGLDYLPGTFGVEYGRATGGIVDAHARDDSPKQMGGFAELSFINVAGLVEGPIGKRASFAVAARRSVIDAILPAVLPSSSGLSFTAYPRYYDYQGKVTYRPRDAWTLGAFVFGTSDEVRLASDADNAMDPVASGQFANATSFTRGIVSARYSTPGFDTTHAASVFVDSNHFSVGADRFLRLDRIGVATRNTATWTARPWLRFEAGNESDITRTDYDIRFTRPPHEGDPRGPNFTRDALVVTKGDNEFRDLAAWISVTARPSDTVELVAGLRGDAYLRNHAYVAEPRVSVTWHVSDDSLVRAATGLYSRPPEHLDEGLQSAIGPERAKQASLAAEHKLLPWLTASATVFVNRMTDLLVLSADRTDMASLGGYVNRGRGDSRGVEFLLKARRDDLFGWLAYTGSIATRQDGPDMPWRHFDYDQTHNLIAVASWQATKTWRFGARFQLTTGKPYTPVVGAVFQSDVDLYEPMYGTLDSQRVATQHQLDLRVDHTWKFARWNLAAYLDVANVYVHSSPIEYRYNFDYTQRTALTTLPILPSFGVRGEL